MKTFKLKTIGKFEYKEVLLDLLRLAPTQGYTVDEVMKAAKAIEELKKAKGEVNFEDDIWGFVSQRVKQAKFRAASKELSRFLDDIKGV